MKSKNLALATTIIAAAVTTSHGAVVITDPGFESPLVNDGNGFEKWSPFRNGPGSSFAISTANPRSGASHLELALSAVNIFSGVSQDIEINAGDDITIDLWHLVNNNTPESAIQIRIEWRDDNGQIDRTANSTPSPGTVYENFSITHTAPAGANTARVVYAINSFGGNIDPIVNVDDFTVTGSTVPEPSGPLLLSLGAIGFIALRKRK